MDTYIIISQESEKHHVNIPHQALPEYTLGEVCSYLGRTSALPLIPAGITPFVSTGLKDESLSSSPLCFLTLTNLKIFSSHGKEP